MVVVAMAVVVVMVVGVVAAAAVAAPAVVSMVAMVAAAVVVAAVAGEGRGPGWRLSGSGRLIGLVVVVTGRSESRGLPMMGAYSISSSGLHSESSGLGDGAASGAGERGTAPGEHEGDSGRVSRRGGDGDR